MKDHLKTKKQLLAELAESRDRLSALEKSTAGARKSTRDIGKQLRFETLLSELSAQFVNLPPEEVDQVITHWLEKTCLFLEAESSALHQFFQDGRRLAITHRYSVPGVPITPMTVTSEEYPWATDMIRRGEVIRWQAKTHPLPAEAASERRFIREQGSRSMIMIPLLVGGQTLGAVIFGTVREQLVWSDELVKRLKLMGEVFANALMRKRFEEELNESRERFKKAFEHSALGMAIFDPGGRFQEANASFCGLVGYSEARLLDMNVLDITQAEDREISQKRLGQALDGELQYFWLDQRYIHADGHEVWCYISCTLLRGADGAPLYFVAHVQDLSERIKFREQLKETNTALKVLLDHRERDQAEKAREMLTALENLVFPYLEKLRTTPLDREQRIYLELIQDNLKDLASPMAHSLVAMEKRLTPTEFQVADLVRRGKTSQEIGALLRMSDAAVFFHRNNIRKKLGLRHSRVNLRSHLAGLD